MRSKRSGRSNWLSLITECNVICATRTLENSRSCLIIISKFTSSADSSCAVVGNSLGDQWLQSMFSGTHNQKISRELQFVVIIFLNKKWVFSCATCETIFANKRSYDNHMLVHAPPDVQLYQCEHCPKTFTKKFKLDKHKLSHLTDEEKQYICDECHKPCVWLDCRLSRRSLITEPVVSNCRYASDALLRAHKRVVHRHTYAHMCEICARVFKSRVFFEKHQLEHLGQNLPKVQCPICEAWMKNEHTMRAHMRNHQDEGQEHQCDICGKKGPSRNAIAKHKRFVHLSERKFKCTLCDKAFKRAITLKEHMTVHTGEVLYTCTFCPKTFNSGANMHAHRKKAHPTEWFEEKQSKLELMKPGEANLWPSVAIPKYI